MSIETSDAEYWRVALTDDGDSFAAVFDRHQHRVFRHSLALVPTFDDAKDVVAVAFLEAWRKRSSVRFVDGSLLPWLLVTATHAAQNISRSARRHRALLDRIPPSPDMPDPADSFDDGPAMAALRSLSQNHQNIVTLCIIEGLPVAEAARVLRVPPGTVKSRLHFAKKALATQLEHHRPPSTLTEAIEWTHR
ncbi:RNA polymerase sigma-70 factor (ECF subfamily) [Conyzicola lurida]|uniref:RNA polymerase sigma-70 factor (ECF subfamily) n=1 Tax=Conyzicola lurida TaxID=1172621 RepID=A0A841AJ74_9MICO|nr:RNA polymerase sigma factor [Conyzicola lurida]MBB5842032.1 RNA polymerase sigma-70 factor (ECF subfamily) [Conyzicola lurida]